MTLRVIEHEPAWEVHAYLRFIQLPYLVEYSPSPTALGHPLPVVVHNSEILSSQKLFRLSSLTNARTLSEPDSQVDKFVSSYLSWNVGRVYEQYVKTTKDHVSRERELGEWILGSFYAFCYEISDGFSVRSDDHYPGEPEEKLVERLEQFYNEINHNLDFFKEDSILDCWPVFGNAQRGRTHASRYGQADAILFGHIARALGHPVLSVKIKQYAAIEAYFGKICKTFFGNTSHPHVEHVWEISLLITMQNRFLTSTYLEVKEMLGREIMGQDCSILDLPTRISLSSLLISETIDDKPTVVSFEEPFLPETLYGKIATSVFLFGVAASFVGYFVAIQIEK